MPKFQDTCVYVSWNNCDSHKGLGQANGAFNETKNVRMHPTAPTTNTHPTIASVQFHHTPNGLPRPSLLPSWSEYPPCQSRYRFPQPPPGSRLSQQRKGCCVSTSGLALRGLGCYRCSRYRCLELAPRILPVAVRAAVQKKKKEIWIWGKRR